MPSPPGSAMLMLAMHRAITGQYAFFNLLAGLGYYKSRWLADSTPLRSAQLYPVGSLPFWRRVLGDLRRRLAARRFEPDQRFNPLKRGAEFARLVAHARRGRCELLSPEDLAQLLPLLAKGGG